MGEKARKRLNPCKKLLIKGEKDYVKENKNQGNNVRKGC